MSDAPSGGSGSAPSDPPRAIATAASAEIDPQAFLGGLVEGVSRALGAARASSILDVDRDRSLSDRLAGRPGAIASLRLTGTNQTLGLALQRGARWAPVIEKVSGGVTISRQTVSLGDWLNAFAGQIAAAASDASGESAAASRALQTLGVQAAGSDIRVDEFDIVGGLRDLKARVAGRVPDAAAALVGRIADALLDALPRVTGSGESEIILQRTATVYLPDTLRAYLALPADWARDHVFADGSTPAHALVAQLTTLDDATGRMRDAALENDAAALQQNGSFLDQRFARSSLDLG